MRRSPLKVVVKKGRVIFSRLLCKVNGNTTYRMVCFLPVTTDDRTRIRDRPQGQARVHHHLRSRVDARLEPPPSVPVYRRGNAFNQAHSPFYSQDYSA